MKKIVIFGKNGQIGSSLVKIFAKEREFKVSSYSKQDVDFASLNALELFLNNLKEIPDFIINASAYTNVDKAEEEKELADLINHKAVEILAKYCSKNKVTLIHYSTDYVFDGSGNEPFLENNKENLKPVNHYGQTKLDGENDIINSGCNYIILRTSWVWSEEGKFKNFVNTIKRLALEKEEISVVNDQIGAPTNTSEIALNTVKIIKKLPTFTSNNFPSGIYHITGNRDMSWYDFALEVVKNLKGKNIELKVKKINPLQTIDYKTPAKRPLNSRISKQKLAEVFNIDLKS